MPSFEDLDAWKRFVELSAKINKETKALRDFGFRDLDTRAGLSIPSNIAEGLEHATPADQDKFLDYARGSCGGARTQTIVGLKVGFIADQTGQRWCCETRELSAMINELIHSFRSHSAN